jgi:hypothetical protein
MATHPYSGSCHCGAVAFRAELDLDHTIECNCSRCRRLGSILSFTPAEKFTLLKGEDQLAEFQFNKHIIHHLFCKTCGVQSFSRGVGRDGKAMAAVNVRCLDGVDLTQLKPQQWDGASM